MDATANSPVDVMPRTALQSAAVDAALQTWAESMQPTFARLAELAEALQASLQASLADSLAQIAATITEVIAAVKVPIISPDLVALLESIGHYQLPPALLEDLALLGRQFAVAMLSWEVATPQLPGPILATPLPVPVVVTDETASCPWTVDAETLRVWSVRVLVIALTITYVVLEGLGPEMLALLAWLFPRQPM